MDHLWIDPGGDGRRIGLWHSASCARPHLRGRARRGPSVALKDEKRTYPKAKQGEASEEETNYKTGWPDGRWANRPRPNVYLYDKKGEFPSKIGKRWTTRGLVCFQREEARRLDNASAFARLSMLVSFRIMYAQAFGGTVLLGGWVGWVESGEYARTRKCLKALLVSALTVFLFSPAVLVPVCWISDALLSPVLRICCLFPSLVVRERQG